MRWVPAGFLAAGSLCALIGMGWGIQMSATEDHTLSPAHGHLNLIGFIAMSIFGFYYALTPQALGRMAQLHLVLTVLAVIVLVPGIAMAVRGTGETMAKIGSILAILSMALFTYMVIRHRVGQNAG